MEKSRYVCAMIALGLAAGAPAAMAQDKAQSGTQDKQQKSSSAAKDKTDKSDAKGAAGSGPIVVLVPFVFGTDEKLANGCWARLYDSENFRGDVLSVVGPVDIANSRVGAFEWGRRFDSIVVGPKATLTVYDNVNFRQKTATFKPGQKVPDLDEKMGFFENVRSLKLTCS